MAAAEHLGQQFTPQLTHMDVADLHSAWANDYDETRGRDLPEVFGSDPTQKGRMSKLTSSVQRYGVRRPLDVAAPNPEEPEHQLIDGHHRLAAAINTGLKRVPVRLHPPMKTEAGYEYPYTYTRAGR